MATKLAKEDLEKLYELYREKPYDGHRVIEEHRKDVFNERILNFAKYGFSLKQIEKMVDKYRIVLDYLSERINNTLQFLKKYGFLKRNIIKMAVRHPMLFSFSLKRITVLFENLKKHGFTKKQIIQIISRNPGIITTSIEKITRLINILKQAGFHPKSISKRHALFNRSADVLKAKINYLKSNGWEIKLNFLVIPHKKFEERFGISKRELLRNWLKK